MENTNWKHIEDRRIEIPRLFFPFLESRPFETCLVCECDLLDNDVLYMIEKAYKGTEVIFEYAMCLSCCEQQRKELSMESFEAIVCYFKDKPLWLLRAITARTWASNNLDSWLNKCAVTGIERAMVENYQLYGLCQGRQLIVNMYPFLISESVMMELGEVLSKKTKDHLDDFVDEYLGMPPEFRDLPNDCPMVLF